MSVYHKNLKRKKSGGRKRKHRKKAKAHIGRYPTETKIAKEREKRKKVRTKGGGEKLRLMGVKWVNCLDKDTGEYEKVEITNFVENPANRHLDRRHIITKGTILQTEEGKVKVTSRPGQDGVLNAVFIEEE